MALGMMQGKVFVFSVKLLFNQLLLVDLKDTTAAVKNTASQIQFPADY